MTERYVITVAVASPTNPGPVVGAWVARRGTRVRPVAQAGELGVCSTHRGTLATILAALTSARAEALPVTVRTNLLPAVQALTAAVASGRDAAGAEAVVTAAIVGAVRAYQTSGSAVTFEFVGNDSGDPDLAAAREAASEMSRQRGTAA